MIRFSYFEFNHNVAEIAKFSKGDFGKRHCNTETVDSNTDQTSACEKPNGLLSKVEYLSITLEFGLFSDDDRYQ